jgi:hypothetical protein
MTDSRLHLGEELDAAGTRNGAAVHVDPAHLTTHGVILGMTGSGKTGLGVVLLEEALLRRIPALIIDPKGDMGNLLLNFPSLRGEDFRPWVDEAEAARSNSTPEEYATRTAAKWAAGLADWDVSPDAMRRLGMNTSFTIFTPGSTAGVPINVVGSLDAPPAAAAGDEAVADRVEGFVSGLLALVNRAADPLSSADHILLSSLIARAWAAGQSLDLATLIGQVANPPIRKLGVFELDTFMPPKERMALAVQLNALLASPSFAAWQRGVPLDMQRLLWDEAGRPRAAIVYLAHLSEPERQFIVTLLMSAMVGWMRRQPGTSELRALVYMDEVAGFAPPTAEPPSKKPMLTILKQARAHGVGMVLSTQNPMDLDYKAISNAGTWMIGRLQTERDKARVLEGMRSAAGDVDVSTLDAMIGGLGPRQFLLHSARGGAPRRFTTRWAMSFLRGPLTRLEIERLMADERATAAAHDGSTATGGPAAGSPATAGPATGGIASGSIASGGIATARPASADAGAHAGGGVAAASTAAGGTAATAAHDTVVPPATATGVRVRYLDPAAPWAGEIGASPGSPRHAAAVAARVHLRFDDAAAGLDMREEYECVWFPLTDPARPEAAVAVDYDERDLRADPPAGATWVLPDAPIDRATYFRDIEKQLRAHLQRTRSAEVLVNRELKLFSRAGESRDAFVGRCRAAAAERADADAAKLRDKYTAKRDRLEKQQRAAEDRVRELGVDTRQRVQQEIVAGAGQLLAAFLGGRGSARSLAGVASRRGMTRRAQERLGTAQGRAGELADELRRTEDELARELAEIAERWDAVADRLDTKQIGLQQADVTVDEVVLLWVPVA